MCFLIYFLFFFQAEDGIRDFHVTGVQTCALPISPPWSDATSCPSCGALLRPSATNRPRTCWARSRPSLLRSCATTSSSCGWFLQEALLANPLVSERIERGKHEAVALLAEFLESRVTAGGLRSHDAQTTAQLLLFA